MPVRRLVAALAAIVVLGTVAGCAGSAPQLAGRAFLSVGVTDGGAAKPLVAGTRVRIDFRDSDLSASAGCNTLGGPFRADNGTLITDSLAMTEMGCDPDRAAQDQWLAQLLGSRPSIRLAGDELTLQAGTVVVRLMDRRVADPDVALAGPTWTVVSIINGDAVSSVPDGATATLQFHDDGTVSVSAGCNVGNATWVAAAGGIRFGALGLTKKACFGAAGELENAVVAVLAAGDVGATIQASMLTLVAGGRGLQLQAS